MSWNLIDHNFWQTSVTLLAIIAAYLVGRKQNKLNELISRTQDAIELYASLAVQKTVDENDKVISQSPLIHIQNVGTRIIYFDQYIFNGKVYKTDGQILPPTYSQALNNFYWVELPTNGETHVSLEVFYHDQENRYWSSMIFADFINGQWRIKTLPRIKNDPNPNPTT